MSSVRRMPVCVRCFSARLEYRSSRDVQESIASPMFSTFWTLAIHECQSLPAIRPTAPARTMNVGVLASHEGTTLQSLLDACAGGRIQGRVAVVVSNNGDSGALR